MAKEKWKIGPELIASAQAVPPTSSQSRAPFSPCVMVFFLRRAGDGGHEGSIPRGRRASEIHADRDAIGSRRGIVDREAHLLRRSRSDDRLVEQVPGEQPYADA